MRQVLANKLIGTEKTLLRAICILEAATGIALLIAPSVLGLLLFGQELSGPATLTARFAGIALLALAVACWPTSPLFAMFFYSAAATLFLGFVGLGGSSATVGVLLWPAMVFHLILAVVLMRLLAQSRQTDLP